MLGLLAGITSKRVYITFGGPLPILLTVVLDLLRRDQYGFGVPGR